MANEQGRKNVKEFFAGKGKAREFVACRIKDTGESYLFFHDGTDNSVETLKSRMIDMVADDSLSFSKGHFIDMVKEARKDELY